MELSDFLDIESVVRRVNSHEVFKEYDRAKLLRNADFLINKDVAEALYDMPILDSVLETLFRSLSSSNELMSTYLFTVILKVSPYGKIFDSVIDRKPSDAVIKTWLYIIDPLLRRLPTYNWVSDRSVKKNDCGPRAICGMVSLLRSHTNQQTPIMKSADFYQYTHDRETDRPYPIGEFLDFTDFSAIIDRDIVSYIIYGGATNMHIYDVNSPEAVKLNLAPINIHTGNRTYASLYYRKYIPLCRFNGNHWEFYNFLIIPPQKDTKLCKQLEEIHHTIHRKMRKHEKDQPELSLEERTKGNIILGQNTTHFCNFMRDHLRGLDIDIEKVPLGPSLYGYARNYMYIPGDYIPPADAESLCSNKHPDADMIPYSVVPADYLLTRMFELHSNGKLYEKPEKPVTKVYNTLYLMFNQSLETFKFQFPKGNPNDYAFIDDVFKKIPRAVLDEIKSRK